MNFLLTATGCLAFVTLCFIGTCVLTILSVRAQLKTRRAIQEIRIMINE